jgi:predicted dehydrogenase
MRLFLKQTGVQVVAVCDIYGEMIDRAQQMAPGAQAFTDHRKLLELKEVDIVLIATPDHWHAQTTIDALNAGKDVYVEKPLTLKIEEGPEIVKAARVNERICQVGMQQRSGPHYIQAKKEYIDTGRLGKITLARTWWHGNVYHLRRAPERLRQKPSNLDWARFLGPVKWRDWDPQQYWNWRAYLDFGGGQITDLFTPLGGRRPHVSGPGHSRFGGRRRRRLRLQGRAHRPGHDQRSAGVPQRPHRHVRGYAGTRSAGAAVEFVGTEGRLWIDRSRFEFQSAEKGAQPVVVKAPNPDMTADPHRELSGVRAHAQVAEWRCADRTPVRAGRRTWATLHTYRSGGSGSTPVHEEILPL